MKTEHYRGLLVGESAASREIGPATVGAYQMPVNKFLFYYLIFIISSKLEIN